MKNLLLILFFAVCLSSCGSTRNNEMFYRGTITKANGQTKQKVFIFGRDQCVRKGKRMARRRGPEDFTPLHRLGRVSNQLEDLIGDIELGLEPVEHGPEVSCEPTKPHNGTAP